eukprot:g2256.t1
MGKEKTKLSVAYKKKDNFSDWYTDVIIKSEMISYYDISGCYILRPWSFEMWEQIRNFFDGEIKKLGVRNSYFPVFVKKCHLEAEKDHVEGFAAEVAWVTKSGASDLAEPIAIRPTSETIMYPAFKNWIQSHRDLPLKLNQWTNVVRWEFKYPTPFLRTREFLWQEGHTAYATPEEADVEVFDILDLYARVYEELLAVPVIKGRKSEGEKFAGGRYTTTVEAFIPGASRAIQGATSHSLGQNFAKMFDITYAKGDAEKGKKEEKNQKHYVWQNSWGITTRTIGVMVMVHGDDKGLVLPPRVAPLQVVVVPLYRSKTSKEELAKIQAQVADINAKLQSNNVRSKADQRDSKTSAWKFNYWETKGVPLRIQLGSRDLANGTVEFARRDTGKKFSVPVENVVQSVQETLVTIQADMLAKARKERDANISVVTDMKSFKKELNKGKMILAPWCEMKDTEELVKEQTRGCATEEDAKAKALKIAKAKEEGKELDEEEEAAKGLTGSAKTLCLPFSQPPMPKGTKCFTGNGKDATSWCLWGRSY